MDKLIYISERILDGSFKSLNSRLLRRILGLFVAYLSAYEACNRPIGHHVDQAHPIIALLAASYPGLPDNRSHAASAHRWSPDHMHINLALFYLEDHGYPGILRALTRFSGECLDVESRLILGATRGHKCLLSETNQGLSVALPNVLHRS